MGRPADVHIVRTRYPHLAAHSGIGGFVRCLDPARFVIHEHTVADSDEDFRVPIGGPGRALLRRAVQRGGTAWYKLSDLAAESRALQRWVAGRADIIHYLDGEHSAQYVPLLARALPRRPRVLATFHQPAALLPGLVREAVVRNLTHVTIVAPGQAAFFERLLPADRIHLILHGIDTDWFSPPPERPERERFSLITVGHWLRDFATIRAVALRLADERRVQFDVVTNRDSGLDSLANVRVHGDLSDEELLVRYRSADALLLPLHDCTANNALLEGMACGLPVITTDLVNVRAYAPGEEAVYTPPGDADAVAAAIVSVMASAERRARMGGAARRRAEELSWSRIAAQWTALYDRMLRG